MVVTWSVGSDRLGSARLGLARLSAGRTNLAEPPFFGGFFLFYMKCAMGRHETSLETVEIPPGR